MGTFRFRKRHIEDSSILYTVPSILVHVLTDSEVLALVSKKSRLPACCACKRSILPSDKVVCVTAKGDREGRNYHMSCYRRR